MICQAEKANGLQLDQSTRKIAKGFVINWLIEITELPVDLNPSTIAQEESDKALARLNQFRQKYQALSSRSTAAMMGVIF
jgi:hypothetical protein